MGIELTIYLWVNGCESEVTMVKEYKYISENIPLKTVTTEIHH